MKPLYKTGAYLTALVHTVYVPITLVNVLHPDPSAVAIANLGVCATGMAVGFFVDNCPLTFIEKWFRRHYSPKWVFPGGWLQYYAKLLLGQFVKIFQK